MPGFVDHLRFLLAWRSAHNPAIGGPYYVDETEIFHAGAVRGEPFCAGPATAQIFHAGAIEGQADGRY